MTYREGRASPYALYKKSTDPNELVGQIVSIPCNLIRRFKDQPRKTIDQDRINKYAQSMVERHQDGKRHQMKHGVVMITGDPKCPFELISGEHRWESCKKTEFVFDALVMPTMSKKEQLLEALAWNYEGEAPTPYELALTLKRLEEDGFNKTQMAAACSVSRAAVSNCLALNNLHPDLFILMNEKMPRDRIPMKTAIALASLPQGKQNRMYEKTLDSTTSDDAVDLIMKSCGNGAGHSGKGAKPPAKKLSPGVQRKQWLDFMERKRKEIVRAIGKDMTVFQEAFGKNCSDEDRNRFERQAQELAEAALGFNRRINIVRESLEKEKEKEKKPPARKKIVAKKKTTSSK